MRILIKDVYAFNLTVLSIESMEYDDEEQVISLWGASGSPNWIKDVPKNVYVKWVKELFKTGLLDLSDTKFKLADDSVDQADELNEFFKNLHKNNNDDELKLF